MKIKTSIWDVLMPESNTVAKKPYRAVDDFGNAKPRMRTRLIAAVGILARQGKKMVLHGISGTSFNRAPEETPGVGDPFGENMFSRFRREARRVNVTRPKTAE